ncbi:hypothetical protein Pst134EA_027878 [Puccinia striiformis f. sp. tritici]|uniref:hypothetical protein n=1 Tax=Puccinia striiformis f. sp. tritici TaxID=168172 RepID=UPI002008B4BF|nr:hypothetical protein Pst134EA_027878 [Puccinia striiformis f. sp. tritici]KAH9448569.1 hypothetical protein Pst134EA_027878 [Puccinia striiformis f. sp. tritici]
MEYVLNICTQLCKSKVLRRRFSHSLNLPNQSRLSITQIAMSLKQKQNGALNQIDNPNVSVEISLSEEKIRDDSSTGGPVDTSIEVHRKLKQRHISMIAMAGTIGTGLFLGSGQSLRHGGPVGTLLGYISMGAVVFSMQVALGEMVTMFPVTGAIPHYAERFFDPAMGFAVGVNMWFAATIALAAEITAAAIVVQYWDSTTPSWIYITIFLVTICAINVAGVRWYGEAEFFFCGSKSASLHQVIRLALVLTIRMDSHSKGTSISTSAMAGSRSKEADRMKSKRLIQQQGDLVISGFKGLISVIEEFTVDYSSTRPTHTTSQKIDHMSKLESRLLPQGSSWTCGGPTHDRIGFRYWIEPGPFVELNGILGPLGRFLGFWTVFIQAAYSYLGVESVAIIAGEAENPRKTIPKAIKRIFFRILIFYIGGVTVAGLLVPSNSAQLASVRGHGTAHASPFVIAINNGGIKILPDIVNAVILLAAYSTGNTALYCGSRILHGLAFRSMAPSLFRKCTKSGLPILALIPTAAGGLLAFLRLNNSGAAVFHWLTRMSAITGLCTWLCILVSYLRFYDGMKYHGINRNNLAYKAPFQPYLSYFGVIMIILVIFFSGFEVFLKGNWSTPNFVTNYITIVGYFLLFAFWKVKKRSKLVRAPQMDLVSGNMKFEAMDAYYKENLAIPKTRMQKFWNWVCGNLFMDQ